MSDLTPITREEALLDGQDLEPITRKEQFIKRIYDKTQEIPEPITREEWFLKKAGEGTSPVTIEQLNATENGTYSEQGKAYSPVIVEVPEPTLITKTITENGTYNASSDDADGYSQVTVNVPYMEKKSASGDIASFSDGAGYPYLKVKANINPVQDLHGYDYPWVGGAGKNLAYFEQGSLDLTNGAETPSTTRVRTNFIPVEQLTTYIASSQNDGWSVRNGVGYDENKDYVKYGVFPSVANNMLSVNDVNVKYVRFIYSRVDETEECSPSDYWYQFEKGSTATTFAPYSNICPISGFTGVNVSVTGVNIWDEQWEVGGYNSRGEKIPSNVNIRSKNPIPVIPNSEYYGNTTVPLFAIFYDEGGNAITVNDSIYVSFTNKKATAPVNAKTMNIRAGNTATPVTTYNNDISINYPSTDTSYHAYNGHVYPISWQDEAGIVYGGYIDLVSGVLTATKAGIAEYNGETLPSAWISDRDRYVAGNTPTIGAQVVYDLAAPQTYQLTPQQINTLIGQNNAWNNTNGQTEVEYFIPIE